MASWPKSEWANGNAYQPQDFDPKVFQHAADLAILAFLEDDFQPGVFLAGAQYASLPGPQQLPTGDHALDECGCQRFPSQPAHVDVVNFVRDANRDRKFARPIPSRS